MYKVILIQAGLGSSILDVTKVEKTANEMNAKGFDLQHIYQTSSPGCCGGSKTAAVMVFKFRQ